MRDSGQMFLVVHEGMRKAGLDVEAIYRRFGYDAQKLDLHGQRTPHRLQAAFWEAVEAVTGDKDIGLHLCPHLPVYRGEILEYLMFSSPTFGDGIQRSIKYMRLISDAIGVRLIEDIDGVRIGIVGSALDAPQFRHTEICVVYEFIQFGLSVTEGSARPQRVKLRCSQLSSQAEYERILGCPVSFDYEENEIWLDPSVLQYRSPRWDPDLLRVHEELAKKRLSNIERQDLIQRIRHIFSRRLELQNCELVDVAKELDLSPRRLRFELAQAGTSFSQLLSEFRFALACKLLADTEERIENIVYLTGFSEPSTFYRAFKRWTGMTPIQYRESRPPVPAPA
jgi:AraC-like DNA-binding protein